MPAVRSAIHVRTGQRASVEAIDAWLARHHVDTTPLDDVYGACVHLLKQYEQIPDLVLVGSDWLSRDELTLVSYVRHTWPRSGIVVYGDTTPMPSFDFLPLVLICHGAAALRELLAASPADLVQRLGEQLEPLVLPGRTASAVGSPPSILAEHPGEA